MRQIDAPQLIPRSLAPSPALAGSSRCPGPRPPMIGDRPLRLQSRRRPACSLPASLLCPGWETRSGATVRSLPGALLGPAHPRDNLFTISPQPQGICCPPFPNQLSGPSGMLLRAPSLGSLARGHCLAQRPWGRDGEPRQARPKQGLHSHLRLPLLLLPFCWLGSPQGHGHFP